jgi:hypothetical protein
LLIVNQPTPNNPAPEDSGKFVHKKGALFQFASLAFMTQVVMLLNQVVLLPIQIRIWGTDVCAYWYSIIAVAAVTGIADFGLRTAGHAELIRHVNDPNDHEARTEFQHLWAWIRILIASTTVLLVITDFLYHHVHLAVAYPLWRPALLVGYAFEVLLGVRIMYLDSQGLYREAEAGYLVMAAGRLILSIGALLFFHAPPAVLAWIYFGTGLLAIIRQSYLCRRARSLHLFEAFPRALSFRTLGHVRYTMADPCSGWMRLNGPVVILSIIAPALPIAIVTYVALRAVFGAARQVIIQIARYASVEFIALRHARRFELAERHLASLVLLATFFASAVAAFVVADNGRLASLILTKMDPVIYQMVAVTFALGNAFYAYQIILGVSRRSGEVAAIAHRQYLYMICIAVFAGIAMVTKSLLLWLVLLLVGDVLAALSFMLWAPSTSILSQTSAGWRGAVAAAASSLLVFAMWLLRLLPAFDFLRGRTISDVICTIAFFLAGILVIGLIDLSLVFGLRSRKETYPESRSNDQMPSAAKL